MQSKHRDSGSCSPSVCGKSLEELLKMETVTPAEGSWAEGRQQPRAQGNGIGGLERDRWWSSPDTAWCGLTAG